METVEQPRPQTQTESSDAGWEAGAVPAYVERADAQSAWYLTTSRIWPLVRHPTYGPIAFGVLVALIIALTVVLSPSTESRFIYTDF